MSDSSIELFLHALEQSTHEVVDFLGYRIGYFNQKNTYEGHSNEDCLFITGAHDFLIFGVLDGAGGHPYGGETSYSIGEKVLQYMRGKKSSEIQLISLIEDANEYVRGKYPEGRTTLCFGAILGHQLRSYSVGDSEIICTNSLGELIYNNIAQSPVGHAVEAGMLSHKEALEHSDRNIVNNMIGDERLRIEVGSRIALKKGSSVIVGSDGLFDNIAFDDVVETIGKGGFEESFNKLKDLCLERKNWRKDDDTSFIFIRKIQA